jgi:parallel beta-helix repeat protein
MGMNVFDRNAGFARGQEQVWGFDKDTAIDSKSYLAPGAKIFYVDPNNAQATDVGNLGEDPTVPLATVAAAVALCRDHQGDTIVVGANDAWQYGPHNRPLAIVESVVIPRTTGGFRIVGASTNPFGVQWQPAADNTACITVHAMDVLIEGFVFVAGGAAGAIGVLSEWNPPTDYGENLTVRGCSFYALATGIALDYAWNCQIYGNYFYDNGVAIVNLSVAGDADFNTYHDNDFTDNTLAISLLTSDSNFIYNNRVYGTAAGTDNFIDLTGGSKNLVSDNYLACSIAQYDVTCSDATSGAWINNHCTNGATTAPPL